MTTTLLFTAGMALICVALIAGALHWLPSYRVYGILALSQVLQSTAGFLSGNTVAACISAAALAYLAFKWWSGGGDDDTKRRLRSLGRLFQGVRRTAPVSTS